MARIEDLPKLLERLQLDDFCLIKHHYSEQGLQDTLRLLLEEKLAPKTYFVWDPEFDGFETYSSKSQALFEGEDTVRAYLEQGDGWDEGVEQVCVGMVTHTTQRVDEVTRPPDRELDEDGCDGEGNDWGDHDFTCNYKLKEVTLAEICKVRIKGEVCGTFN